MVFNTPGGYISGLDQTVDAMQAVTKPINGIVTDMCCSAGYYLASNTSNLKAVSRGTTVGSIGTAVSIVDYTEARASDGVKVYHLTNSASPDKRPDITTEEGRDVVVDELNEAYALFEERIIEGRGGNNVFSIENVRSLKGRVVLAKKAMELGLIDGIKGIATKSNQKPKGKLMDLKEAIAANPAIQEELNAMVEQAKKEATADERSRIEGMITLTKTAVSAELKEAIAGGQTKEALAVKILEAMSTPAVASSFSTASPVAGANTGVLPSVAPSATAVPGVQPALDADAEEAKKLDAMLDSVFKKAK
jgi:ClpP class serine protease